MGKLLMEGDQAFESRSLDVRQASTLVSRELIGIDDDVAGPFESAQSFADEEARDAMGAADLQAAHWAVGTNELLKDQAAVPVNSRQLFAGEHFGENFVHRLLRLIDMPESLATAKRTPNGLRMQ
jgi:hypothetical protein